VVFNGRKSSWRARLFTASTSKKIIAELSDNDWEAIKRKGDAAVEKWIDGQLAGRSCAIVLVGARTALRPWVKYEIKKAWLLGKGVVGIRIHKLLNAKQETATAGANPFDAFNISSKSMSSIVTLYDPPGADSKAAYKSISDNIGQLADAAVAIRAKY
jgi:MTH538 TIR-like domain (DUF1863)